MATNNFAMIVAGRASVEFTASVEKFKKELDQNKTEFKGSTDAMYRRWLQHLEFKGREHRKALENERRLRVAAFEKEAANRRREEAQIRESGQRMARFRMQMAQQDADRALTLEKLKQEIILRSKRWQDKVDAQIKAAKDGILQQDKDRALQAQQFQDVIRLRYKKQQDKLDQESREAKEKARRFDEKVGLAEQARKEKRAKEDADRLERQTNREIAAKRRVIEFGRDQDRKAREHQASEHAKWTREYARIQERADDLYQKRKRRQMAAAALPTGGMYPVSPAQALAHANAMAAGHYKVAAAISAQVRAAGDLNRANEKLQQQHRQDLQTVAVAGTFLGREMARVGKQGLAVVMDSVRQYGTVESFMNTIRGSVRDNTNDIIGDMQRLEKQAYALGESTEYDAAHIASGMDRMAIGNATPDQINRHMRSVVDTASIFSNPAHGKVMPDQAARTLQEIMNAQGKSFDWIPELSDKLAVAARQADLSLTNIGDALRYSGGIASEAGMQFDELLAALVVLDKRGQKGEMGGTAIRGIMASLLSPTDNARKEYEQFGIHVPEKGKMSLISIIEQFEVKLAGLSEIERAAVISEAFPNRQMSGVQMLMGASGQVREQMGKYQGAGGKSAEIAATKREGVAFALDVFDSALQTLKAAFGKTLKDDVTRIAKALAEAMGWLARMFNDNPNLGKMLGGLAVGLVALGTAVGTLFSAMGGLAGLALLQSSVAGIAGSGLAGSGAAGMAMGLGGMVSSLFASITAAFLAAISSPAVIAVGIAALVVGIGAAIDQFFNGGELWDAIQRLVQGKNTLDSNGPFSAPPGSPGAAGPATYANMQGPAPGAYVGSDNQAGPGAGKWRGFPTMATPAQMAENEKQQVIERMARFARDDDLRGMLGTKAARKPSAFSSKAEIDVYNKLEDLRTRGEKEFAAATGFNGNPLALGLGQAGKDEQKAWDAKQTAMRAREAKAIAEKTFEGSKLNPKNKAAWDEFAKEHSDPLEADTLGDEGAFRSFLLQWRKKEKAKLVPAEATAPRALAQLGDYNLRSAQGMNYVLDLLEKKTDKDGKELAKKAQLAAVDSAKHLEQIAGGMGQGLVLGGKGGAK